jgi:hypothetical protein
VLSYQKRKKEWGDGKAAQSDPEHVLLFLFTSIVPTALLLSAFVIGKQSSYIGSRLLSLL